MDTPTLELFLSFFMTNELLPPIKIAVLIDGGFFIKRFNALYNKDRHISGAQVADIMYAMAHKHVGKRNILYRIFYYDCMPLGKKAHNPISKKAVDFSKTPEYKFRVELMEALYNMSGTKAGGLKAAATNREKYGKEFYSQIGRKGGQNGHTGGFAANPALARIAGAKGGRISRRGPAKKAA